jgi:hypothetical protein
MKTKALNLTTAKIGECITFRDNDTKSFKALNGSWKDFEVTRGDRVTVTGLITLEEYDDHCAILDGEFYPSGDKRPTVLYTFNVYSPLTGEIIGTAFINPLEVLEVKKPKWVDVSGDSNSLTKALRRAIKLGQTEVVKGLVKAQRLDAISVKLNARRSREKQRNAEPKLEVVNE